MPTDRILLAKQMTTHIKQADEWAENAERLAEQDPGSLDHDVAIDMAIMHARIAIAIKAVHFP